METLQSLLTTILVTRQVTRNLTETVIPFATKQVQLLLTAFQDHLPSNIQEVSYKINVTLYSFQVAFVRN